MRATWVAQFLTRAVHNEPNAFWVTRGEEIITCTLFGVIAFVLLYRLIDMGSRTAQIYRTLTGRIRLEWTTRIVSSLHAGVVVTACCQALRNSKIWDDPVSGHSDLMHYTAIFSLSYMLVDSVVMTCSDFYYRARPHIPMYVHHGVTLVCLWVYVCNGIYTYPAALLLLTESTTPLLNLRWFLCRLGDPFKSVTCINGVILTWWVGIRLQICGRLCLFCYHQWMEVRSLNSPANPVPLWGVCMLCMIVGVLSVANLYWFALMLRAAARGWAGKNKIN